MPVRESTATALVRCTGLAMICVKDKAPQCEIGFVRDDAHVLTFRILQPFFKNGSNDVAEYRAIASYQELPNENVSIEINVPGVAGCDIYQNDDGDLDRLNSRDTNDFRWLVQMEKLYGEGNLKLPEQPEQKQKPPYPLTRIKLGSGLFYSHQLDRGLLFEKVQTDANGEGQPEPFGRIAKTLGVLLRGDRVTVKIRSTDIEEKPLIEATHSLPRVEGLPSIIELSNVDPDPNAAYSDMPIYDQYIPNSSGKKIELRPVRRAPGPPADQVRGPLTIDQARDPRTRDQAPGLLTADQISQVDFCHPVVLPLDSLDQL